jgi:Amt family ammonium transporter
MNWLLISLVLCLFLGATETAMAEEDVLSIADVKQGLDTVWVLIAAFLVFFMQAGFGMVEAGFIRAKNTCNILTKNFLDFCMASLGFFLIGYALMFGDGNGFIGTKGWKQPAGFHCMLSGCFRQRFVVLRRQLWQGAWLNG